MDIFDERKLLDYETYEDYLDSLVQTEDIFYLRNRDFARMNAALGYRTAAEVLNRSAFYTRKQAIHEAIYPSRKPHILFSARYYGTDDVLTELASRERPNRVGMMTTIISIRQRLPNGVEISGFIDFDESLRKCIYAFEEAQIDWFAVFKNSRRIRPTKKDLGYYNWASGFSCMNDTKNFKAITDPMAGLIFESRHDRHHILMDPLVEPTSGTTRTVVDTDKYDSVVLFDHVVRGKI